MPVECDPQAWKLECNSNKSETSKGHNFGGWTFGFNKIYAIYLHCIELK